MANVYRIMMARPDGTGVLRRPRCAWVCNIKMHLREDGVTWTGFFCLRTETNGRAFLTR